MDASSTRGRLLIFWVALWLAGAGCVVLAKVHRDAARSNALSPGTWQRINAMRAASDRVTRIAGAGWLVLFAGCVALATTRHGAALARGALAAAAVFTLAAATHAVYTSAYGSPRVCVGGVMLAVSGGFVVIGRSNERLIAEDTRRQGLCAECGYDLRHSPHRCPECGTPVPFGEAGPDVASPSAGTYNPGVGRPGG